MHVRLFYIKANSHIRNVQDNSMQKWNNLNLENSWTWSFVDKAVKNQI